MRRLGTEKVTIGSDAGTGELLGGGAVDPPGGGSTVHADPPQR
jgi:hypothetical protein